MVRKFSLLILLMTTSIAMGQPIVFPKPEIVPQEKPSVVVPVAKPLTPDLAYAIQYKTDCVVKAFPKDRVSITKDVVPEGQTLRWDGNFWDGKKSHIYTGPVTIYKVEAIGKGPVDIVLIPVGFKSETEILTTTIEVDNGKEPKPDDPKPPEPKPVVELPPIPGPGLKVLITYETGESIPVTQHSILFGKTVREYLEAKCPPGPDGKTKEYRIWDKDVDPSGESKTWQDAMKRPRTQNKWCIISDGKSKANSYEGPLPTTVDEFMKLLRKAGE